MRDFISFLDDYIYDNKPDVPSNFLEDLYANLSNIIAQKIECEIDNDISSDIVDAVGRHLDSCDVIIEGDQYIVKNMDSIVDLVISDITPQIESKIEEESGLYYQEIIQFSDMNIEVENCFEIEYIIDMINEAINEQYCSKNESVVDSRNMSVKDVLFQQYNN